MADFHFKAGGTWRTLATSGAKIKTGGSWTQVKTIWAKAGGTWREIWNDFVVTLSGTSPAPVQLGQDVTDPANCTSGLRLARNGALQFFNAGASAWQDYAGGGGIEWGFPRDTTVGDGYWVKATKISGIDPTDVNDGFGTYLQLTDAIGRQWSHLRLTIGTDGPTVIKVDVSTTNNDSGIVATGYYEIEAIVSDIA